MFTFGVPLHGKSPYVKSLLLVEKKQDFVIRVTIIMCQTILRKYFWLTFWDRVANNCNRYFKKKRRGALWSLGP